MSHADPPATASPKPAGILKQDSAATENPASPSSYLGLNYAVSPRSTPKSVSIAQQAETISPLILGNHKSVEELSSFCPRPAVKSPRMRRMSGRQSNTSSPAIKPMTPMFGGLSISDSKDFAGTHDHTHGLAMLVDQVSAWIKEERSKRLERRAARPDAPSGAAPATPQSLAPADADGPKERRDSDASIDLDRLENIVKQNMVSSRQFRPGSLDIRRKSSIRKLRRKQSSISSDTDYFDGEFSVPSCDAVLDNSKTLAYTGGGSDSSGESSSDELTREVSYRNHDAWAIFKFEIVRLTHTLRLKGWRKVPMDTSNLIEVQRLSGALTNAVYVVSPPTDLPPREDAAGNPLPPKPPPKLLLRIYGPQVEHLIDREAELAILRRLARKHIGPRMLGTFANGRFEEFFHAQPLTAEGLRNADTSRQIAKRMRELHEGMELLDQERDDGPFVWRNWDKWLARVEQIVTWMDEEFRQLEPGVKPTGTKAWLRRGYICGVPWKTFRGIVEKYRVWLQQQYGSPAEVRDRLVFAHNDTQYGNILRLVPTSQSPLLLPANTHKQLVVIDFEYSSANTPGLEFANHFTEWCYNYHDKRKPYACNTNKYPTAEEQERFLRSYVRHRPHFNYDTPKFGPTDSSFASSPQGEAAKRPTNSISEFMLDARMPRMNSSNSVREEQAQKASEDQEVARLMHETNLWRLANSAMWIAWGIVQAKIPGMPTFDASGEELAAPADSTAEDAGVREALGDRADEYKAMAKEQQPANAEEQEEEFDYLGYAQHRVMFFWGDALQLGLVKAEELPEEVTSKIKHVPLT